jgi:hypothetical protein
MHRTDEQTLKAVKDRRNAVGALVDPSEAIRERRRQGWQGWLTELAYTLLGGAAMWLSARRKSG